MQFTRQILLSLLLEIRAIAWSSVLTISGTQHSLAGQGQVLQGEVWQQKL
jgi:hypothetical protein